MSPFSLLTGYLHAVAICGYDVVLLMLKYRWFGVDPSLEKRI